MKDTEHSLQHASRADRIRFPAKYVLASMTDERGIITYANKCFLEVGGFSSSELIGAPHRIVRHPEMPRGLFHLFWQELKAGRPVGAYVKNLSKNGQEYSVFSLAAPTIDGFLSVRIRPVGGQIKSILRLYEEMKNQEDSGVSAEETATGLLEGVRALGFKNYQDFMCHSFRSELQARNRDMQRPEAAQLTALDDLSTQVTNTLKAANELGEGFKNISGEPANIRILSNRLENGGSSISTIAQNYDLMAREMGTHIDRLCSKETGSLAMIGNAAAQGRFALLTSHLISELAAHPDNAQEAGEPKSWVQQGQDRIKAHSAHLNTQAGERLRDIVQACNQIPDLSRRLRRRINGMDVVKLLCRVENCRIGSRDTGLNGVITRLDSFHKDADDILSRLSGNAIRTAQIAQNLL